MATASTPAARVAVSIDWGRTINEHGQPMLWLASWLVDDAGREGKWFYSGRGEGTEPSYAAPPCATGLRIRRWSSEGLDAEYADVAFDAGMQELQVVAPDLPFDEPSPYRHRVTGGA